MPDHVADTRSSHLGLSLGFTLAMFLFAGLACNGTGQPDEDIAFTVQRLDTQVFSGAPSDSLTTLASASPQRLPEGHRVSTDTTGQALLQGQWSTNQTCSIYVFHSSNLVTKACARSNYQGGNTVTCQEENTAVYRKCQRHVMMTPSSEVQVVGSWLSLTYLPDRQLTLVIVADGVADVYPVTRFEDGALADPIRVEAQQFLYTAPDAMLHELAELPPREALPVGELQPLVDELGIEPWYVQVEERAEQDGVPIQPEPSTTPPPATPSSPPVAPSPTQATPSPVPTTPSPAFTPTPGARDMHFIAQLTGLPSPPEKQGGIAWAIWEPYIVEYLIPRFKYCDGEPYPGDPEVIYWGTSQENTESDLNYGQTIEVYGECFLDAGNPAVRILPQVPYFLRTW